MGMYLLLCSFLVFLSLLTTDVASSMPTLPQVEVDAVNALIRISSRISVDEFSRFSESDCGVKFQGEVKCNCSFNNNKICGVTALRFSSLDMNGKIPKEIANLASLIELDLSYNSLYGPIPSSLENLSSLSYIDLSSNSLNGPIPPSLENLSSLSSIFLDYNSIGGPIPTFFGRMNSLRTLSLTGNSFNDSIPAELGDLPSLKELYLDGNSLSNKVPPQLGNIARLETLDLSDNRLSGRLPPELGNLTNLLDLYLSDNRLSGRLPPELGNLTNLQNLDLSDNQLSGTLPKELGNLGQLEDLLLANNEFSGELPQDFKKLINLTSFNVRGNNFNGCFDFIAYWKNLLVLVLLGNNFEGPSPEVFQSLTELQSLHLADITGGFQFPILNSTYLKFLTLRNCFLDGQIPESIWGNRRLSYLDLSFNKLTGEIPTFASDNLLDIYLRGNELNKSSPEWFKNITKSYVDVSENSFTNLFLPPRNISKNWNLFSCCSEIKTEDDPWKKENYHCDDEKTMYDNLYINCGGKLETVNGSHYEADLEDSGRSTFFMSDDKRWGYSSMGRWSSNYLDHYIVNRTCNVNMAEAPSYIGARIAPISLKYYGFCLKNGNYTVKLHFAEISLKENEEPGSMEMRIFDGEIQGKNVLRNFSIVKEAGGVNKDVTREFIVPVSTNLLEIHLFWAGKGSVGDQSGSYGPLISAISVHRAPAPAPAKLSAITIAGIVASALVIPALVLVFLWKLGWFGRKGLHDEELKGIELLPGGFFNFRQIKAATQNFSSANKLGEGGFGSVYKGVLPNGTAIAVKQLSAKSKQGIREFVNEVGTISALQHPNLVRLQGCCAEDNQLLLVYEYMENNSLAHAFFGSEELRLRLNWPTRVKICLGIAKGLAYLHEESKLKIVHRDIKPTNILLDKDLNAKISDFGFAKLYEGEMTHVITKIAGTTGYMAPEYAMRGLLTNKADVYSFGVVTLEIISGKNSASYPPNDESVYLLDLAYVSKQKGNLIELVDQNLGSEYASEEAITILELAMLCTNPSPTLRPAMSEVVKILEGERKIDTTPVSAPYSMDDLTMAKHIAGLSQSTQFFSSSQEGTSNANSSQAFSKEVKKSEISADCSAEITG